MVNGLQKFTCMMVILACIPLLQGCAHSSVNREAAGNVDIGYLNLQNSFSGSGSLNNAYQNSTQTTKGVVMGGIGGAVVGSMISGVGIVPGAASGAIFGGAFGAYIDRYTTMADKLENRHIKVFTIGDQMMIVVPSEHIFVDRTPNIQTNAYSTLDLIAKLIGDEPNISVQVAAYTNAVEPPNIARSLTREQANNIVKYLWRAEVNTRLLYAVGGGCSSPVSPNSMYCSGENDRVEITLEKLPGC